MVWFYVDASRRPFETREDRLPGLIASGMIRPETLVWNEAMTAWRSAGETLPGLFPVSPPVLTAAQRRQLLKAPVGTMPVAGVPTDPVAVCSLVFGFLGLPICFPLFSIPAIICGHIARRRARQQVLASGNSGLALAGLIMGYLGFAIMVVFLVVYVGMIAFTLASGGSKTPVGPE